MAAINEDESLRTLGYELLRDAAPPETVQTLRDRVSRRLQRTEAGGPVVSAGSIRSRGGVVYAARNLTLLFPELLDLLADAPLLARVREVLGDGVGWVRGLFFDKPPEQTWSLPWHQDLTIAVQDNRLPTKYFRNPTRKAGVDHVEASRELLGRMLTARIHLDDAHADNGALRVLPGTHLQPEWQPDETAAGPQACVSQPSELITADAGDALLMRPLLAHCSGVSSPGCLAHRRVIHLEFAADGTLPDGYRWHTFHRLPERRVPDQERAADSETGGLAREP